MTQTDLFSIALHIESPFYIDNVEFNSEKKRLDIHIDSKPANNLLSFSERLL